MGIHNITKLIQSVDQTCIKQVNLKTYAGKKIVFDANQSMYQFLIALPKPGQALTAPNGDTTSHLQGTFWRTVKLVESGIKPVYVLDGQFPEAKTEEITKRREIRQKNEIEYFNAIQRGDSQGAEKFQKRMMRPRSKHLNEVKHLLDMMGLPVISAPGEAEAQCAAIASSGLVHATASEDMDSLTFGSPILVRGLYGDPTRAVSYTHLTLPTT
eukprot:TRINITY_DN9813_c0_g1_i1.p1 TRINITY_DN9813_c0_g1~~TRINITY_DN9813_c0_g1_i1.p1  ORF type:complete len:213 (+),score=53.27 TRINITY_DN9813_c0_g1_i1:49-687(+)